MAASESRGKRKKYFTVAHANATLPLIRAIVKDIVDLTRELQERHDLLSERHVIDEAHREELQEVRAAFERDKERLAEYCRELEDLGIELKDPANGVDRFPLLEGQSRSLPLLAARRSRGRLLARAGRRLCGTPAADKRFRRCRTLDCRDPGPQEIMT